MTKRKAIEAAIERGMSGGIHAGKHLEYVAAEAYEYGRIAGRGEAIAQLPKRGLWRAGETKGKLRQWANALAKKARAK